MFDYDEPMPDNYFREAEDDEKWQAADRLYDEMRNSGAFVAGPYRDADNEN